MPTLLYFLLGGALVSCMLFVVTERQFLEALCNNWRWLGLILLVTLLWRLPFDGHWFFGLEYEDSYIYSVSARYVNSGTIMCSPGNSCYLTTVCAVGNQNSCRLSETSSGHFLGYPLVIAIASRVFGYSPAMAARLSLTASMATVVLIFLSGKLIGGETAGLAASVIFGLTPVFAVQGVGAYAEPVSNMLVVACFLLCVRLVNSDADSTRALLVNWLALTFTAVLAVAVKRENVLLVPVITLTGLMFNVDTRNRAQGKRWLVNLAALLSGGICIVFAVVQLRIVTVVRREMLEYAVFPFNAAVLRTMLPLFLKSYSSVSWYLGGGILVLLGLIASMRAKRRGVYAVGALIAYLLLYASHVRSYYQLQSGDVTQFDTLRYSMNIAGLWSILAGLGFAFSAETLAKWRFGAWLRRRPGRVILWLFVGAYIVSSWVLMNRWKEDMVSTELAVRIEPAEAALEQVDDLGAKNTFVITLEPLLVQMFCREPVNVIAFPYLSGSLVQDVRRSSPDATFLYVEQAIYRSETYRERYRAAFDFLDGLQKERLSGGKNYAIYRINMPEGAQVEQH
ncbi:MAG: hypothetical protein WB711_04625 [Terriglobales bacterium]